jgi:putative ABC transport system ATP-binding protein
MPTIALDLVSRALVSARHPRSPGAVAAALQRTGGDVVRALRDLGVAVDVFDKAPEGALQGIGAGSPALARADDRWVLLADRRANRIQVQDEHDPEGRWYSPTALAELDLRQWVLLPPAPVFPDADHDTPPLSRLWALLSVETEDIITVTLFAIGVGLLSLATPVAVQALVNTVAWGTAVQPLLVLTILLAGGLALGAGLQLLQTWVVELLRRRLFVRLVSDLAYRLPRVNTDALRGGRGPELVNRFFDLFTLEKAVSTWLGDGLGALITAAVGLAVLAVYHPALLVFDLLLGASVVAVFLGLGRGGINSAVKESKAKYALAAWLEEVARHPVAFKAAGADVLARDRTDALARDFLHARQKHFRVVLRQLAGALGLQVVAAAGLLGVGGWLVIQRQLTLGQLVAAELIVATTVSAFAKSSKLLEAWYDLLAAVDKIGHLTDLPLEPSTEKTTGLKSGPLTATMMLPGHAVRLAPGERVGVTGPSGAGKSTALEALFGLRHCTAQIDDVPVDDVDRDLLRSRTALVQGFEVLEATILDNLRFGRPTPSRADAWRILRKVGLGDVVSRLDDGLDAHLSPSGAPLTQAEAQALVVARSLVAKPDLLLVDEAIDGLPDSVVDAVFDGGWTAVIVSQSAEVLTRCDRVIDLSPEAN